MVTLLELLFAVKMLLCYFLLVGRPLNNRLTVRAEVFPNGVWIVFYFFIALGLLLLAALLFED